VATLVKIVSAAKDTETQNEQRKIPDINKIDLIATTSTMLEKSNELSLSLF
jgi:hypothetical protein